jgi:hypothetical protein
LIPVFTAFQRGTFHQNLIALLDIQRENRNMKRLNTLFVLLMWGLTCSAEPSCQNVFSELMGRLAEVNKKRASSEEIAPELRPIIEEIVDSGTRTPEQHKRLAKAVVDYLEKNGVKAKIEGGFRGASEIRIESVSKDSPFQWAVNVPKAIAKRFKYPIYSLFDTEHILNPYTRGFKGGSAQFRSASWGESAIVFSAKSLMTKKFDPPGNGHEVIHAKTKGDSVPQLILEAKNYKPTGKVGADLYGREFSTDEVHSAYAFTVRTAVNEILKKKDAATPPDAYSEVELTTLRNGLLQDLYETAKPVYEAALKPGAIKKSSIQNAYGWGGDRMVLIETENGNSYWIKFSSKQVNRWKLEQNPDASTKVDWSRDPKTVKAMIERDYAASKKAARESELLIDFVLGPNPQYDSLRDATNKISQIRDFYDLGNGKSTRDELIEASERILSRGAQRIPEGVDRSKLVNSLIQMQRKARKEKVSVPEGHVAFQKNDGTWITIDGTQKGDRPIEELMDEVLSARQK